MNIMHCLKTKYKHYSFIQEPGDAVNNIQPSLVCARKMFLSVIYNYYSHKLKLCKLLRFKYEFDV